MGIPIAKRDTRPQGQQARKGALEGVAQHAAGGGVETGLSADIPTHEERPEEIAGQRSAT